LLSLVSGRECVGNTTLDMALRAAMSNRQIERHTRSTMRQEVTLAAMASR
jgi:hypothetical protein